MDVGKLCQAVQKSAYPDRYVGKFSSRSWLDATLLLTSYHPIGTPSKSPPLPTFAARWASREVEKS